MSQQFAGEKLIKKETPPHAGRHEAGGPDEIDLSGLQGDEIRLVPKTASTGPEGTIFYNSSDDHVYVATEV